MAGLALGHCTFRSSLCKGRKSLFFGGFQIVGEGGGDSGLGAQPPTAGSSLTPPSVWDPPRGLSRSFSDPSRFAFPCGPPICCGLCPSSRACPVGGKQKTWGRKCHFSLRFVFGEKYTRSKALSLGEIQPIPGRGRGAGARTRFPEADGIQIGLGEFCSQGFILDLYLTSEI